MWRQTDKRATRSRAGMDRATYRVRQTASQLETYHRQIWITRQSHKPRQADTDTEIFTNRQGETREAHILILTWSGRSGHGSATQYRYKRRHLCVYIHYMREFYLTLYIHPRNVRNQLCHSISFYLVFLSLGKGNK